jgi:DNA topoisomerase-3
LKLMTTGKTDLLAKFISKKGRPFSAYLVAGEGGKVNFEFEPRKAKAKTDGAAGGAPKEPAVKIDFTGKQTVGKCPKCGGKVFDTEAGYICERSQLDMKPCKFKLDKEKAGRQITLEEAKQLLAEGRTDLLVKFVSRVGKPFSAHLVLEGKGKVVFEFPPREDDGGGG